MGGRRRRWQTRQDSASLERGMFHGRRSLFTGDGAAHIFSSSCRLEDRSSWNGSLHQGFGPGLRWRLARRENFRRSGRISANFLLKGFGPVKGKIKAVEELLQVVRFQRLNLTREPSTV